MKKINISSKELVRDIMGLNVPNVDIIPDEIGKDFSFYDDEMNEWLDSDLEEEDEQNK